MKKRVLLLGLVVLMVLTGCGTTEKETKTKEKDPDKLVLNIEDKKEVNIINYEGPRQYTRGTDRGTDRYAGTGFTARRTITGRRGE